MSGKDGSRIRWERSARACALVAVTIAALVVLRTLAAPVAPPWLRPPHTTMRPVAALAVLCAAASLVLTARRWTDATRVRRATRWGLVALTTLFCLGAASLAQELLFTLGVRPDGLMRLLALEDRIGGRMSLVAAAQFLLIGIALVAPSSQRHRVRQMAALTVLAISLIVITGYAYDYEHARSGMFQRIALSTAVCQALLAAGLLAVRPNRGVTAILVSDSAGGMIARRLLPAAIFVPLLLGWIQTRGQAHGWYDPGLGEAMMAVSTVSILLVLTWLAARQLRRLDGERRRAQASVNDSEARFRATFEQAAVGVAHVSTAGRYIRVNQRFCEITGYSRRELLWLTFSDITYAEDLSRDVSNFRRALAGEIDTFRIEKRYIRRDGSPIWVQLTVSLVRRARDNRPDYFIAVTEDITQRKHIQEDRDGLLQREQVARAHAEAASRAKDQLLAVVSHELRTPLTPVMLMVSAMQRDPQVPEQVRADLAVVLEQVQRESRLIEDLLDITRASRGKLSMKPEPMDLHALLCEIVRSCEFDIHAKHQRLSLELSAGQAEFQADPARLRQVFLNLLTNAIKFTPEGGRITVRSENRQGQWIVVRIADSGIGIAPDAIGRLFEPFEQAERTVTRQFGGLGLGLSICRSLVQMHGGTIRAESAGHGRGATFTVELPLAPSRAVIVESTPALNEAPLLRPELAPPARSFDEPHSTSVAPTISDSRSIAAKINGIAQGGAHGNGKHVAVDVAAAPLRILIVEDNLATLQVLARLVRSWGHDVVTASTASTAMQIALHLPAEAQPDGDVQSDTDETSTAPPPIDLMLCDIGLPDMSGWELMRQVAAGRPGIMGFALSGFASDDDVRRSKEAGFLGHMAKPVDLHKLESLLRGIAIDVTHAPATTRPPARRYPRATSSSTSPSTSTEPATSSSS